MEEIWKDIPGYKGYKVSNLGNVMSFRRYKTGRKLKASLSDGKYLKVAVMQNGQEKTVNIHRLVALSFLPNPNKLPIVNHKDENKTNNRPENLEWCDFKYNSNYGTRNNRISSTKEGKKNPRVSESNRNRARQIEVFDRDTNHFLYTLKGPEEVKNKGFDYSTVVDVANGKYKQHKNRIFKWVS